MGMATLLFVLGACAGTAPQTARATTPPDTVIGKPAAPAATMPAEDVSRYRPTFAPPKPGTATAAPVAKALVPPTAHVTAQVEQRLRDQAYTNQNVKYAQGYRILAYLGLERDKVMAIRRAVISRYPDETDYITFKAPVYRLYIGDYLTKLEAARGLARVRPLTQKAELESTQVLLNKNP
jgi:hypothetical protein